MRLEEVKSTPVRLSKDPPTPWVFQRNTRSVLLEENQMSGVIGWATEINLGIPTGVSKRDKNTFKKLNIYFLAALGPFLDPNCWTRLFSS